MNEMLTAGIELLLIGMGMVYAFLAMLVIPINVMTAFVRRYFPEMPPKFAEPVVAAGADKAVVAAIMAAVHQYRKKHNKTCLYPKGKQYKTQKVIRRKEWKR